MRSTSSTLAAYQVAGESPKLRERYIAAKRRAYNRAYMRAWRADPRHRLRERETRAKSYLARKLRDALRERRLLTNDSGQRVCGFCGKLPPIGLIQRLQIRQTLRGEFVKVRIPYCGQC